VRVPDAQVRQVTAYPAGEPGQAVALAQVRRDDRLARGCAVANVDIGSAGRVRTRQPYLSGYLGRTERDNLGVPGALVLIG
jgi:hypothetical protein